MKKLTIESVKESFEKEGYTLLSKEYVNNSTKLEYLCLQGHKHSISWNSWQQGRRYPYCSNKARLTFEFVKNSFEKENYMLLSKKYINNSDKLKYICSKGHVSSIRWNDWQQGIRCPTCYLNNKIGQGNSHWKGGVTKRQLPLYNTYYSQLSYCEETRRNPADLDLLEVRCTKCGNFFTPSLKSVNSRIAALNGWSRGENRFYCSNGCKHSCSIYRKIKYAANEKQSKKYISNPNFTSEELKTWSKEVLKRANNFCEYCGGLATEAHHIQPKKLEPFLALDPENGIACCESCHYKYGHKEECSTGNLANIMC